MNLRSLNNAPRLNNALRRSALAAIVALCSQADVADAQPAQTAQRWGLGTFSNRGVDPNTLATFRDLLRDEIRSRMGVSFLDVGKPCDDIECVRAAAAGTGVTVVVHGSVSRLGTKLVISVNTADMQTGATMFSERMNAAGPEELDVIAARMAEAMARGTSTAETAELGMITQPEAKKPLRRSGRFAGTFTLQGLMPLEGFAGEVRGGGVEMGMWFETLDIAVEPRIGARFDLGDEARDYFHVPIEVGASYLFSRGDISPLLGVGAGLHFVWEKQEVSTTEGEELLTTNEAVIEDNLSLFAVFIRGGVMVMRTYTTSVVMSLDYAVGFGEFSERTNEQAVRFNIQLIFGK